MDDIEYSNPPRRRRRRRRRNNTGAGLKLLAAGLAIILVLLTLVAGGVMLFGCNQGNDDPTQPSGSTAAPSDNTEPSTTDPAVGTTDPTDPPGVTLVSTATVSATGDMLMHMPCIRPAQTGDNTYDFTPYFTHLQDYIMRADYAVANLETTLAGLDNGYEYHGYPDFNCPDDIVYSLQDVGFDMLLTANNHCYDTSSVGYHRTQQVLKEAGMDYTGTFSGEEDAKYLVKDINGIKIGMICYTYEDASDPNTVAPNGRPLTNADKGLINAFHTDHLDTFYEEMEDHIAAMETDGAEAVVLYIHWGVEYQLKQNATQEKIAQKMCDLGVDVIVGGHPHVIQPMELLTSTTDPEHKTVCLYSTGNTMSNQRLGNISYVKTAHTEDGILFTFSFAKYSDGTVRVEDVELLPLWINLYTNSATGKKVYDVLPLDKQIEDWKTQLNLTDNTLAQAEDSYERTMEIVGDGLEEVEEYLSTLPAIEE